MNFDALQNEMADDDVDQQNNRSNLKPRAGDVAAKLYGTYQLLEELGHGAYGRVTKAKHQVNRSLFAIKHIDKKKAGSKGLSEVVSEVETMNLLSHQNIVHLEETFQDENNLWIVMEYVPGGELQQALKKVGHFDEQTVRRMAIHLLLAVDHIHAKGVVHRDLKPANCLLAEDGTKELKIADFGFSVLVGVNNCLTSFCGTTAFMAPEIIADRPYGKPVDMWAIGVILYQLLSGEYPFRNSSGEPGGDTMEDAIVEGRYNFNSAVWEEVGAGSKDLVAKLLVVDADRRMTASQGLNHYWIRAGMNSECDLFDFDHSSDVGGSSNHGKNQRTGKMLFRAGVHAVIAAHRLVYSVRCMALKREGSDYPILRSYSYLVSRRYRPTNQAILATNLCYGNMRAVFHLVAMLEASDSVETFDVSNNGIDSLDVLQQIVKVASVHPSLTVLNLENNPIPPLAGRALLRLARAGTKIRVINVNNTALGLDVIQQISQCLKEVEKKRGEGSGMGMSGYASPAGAASPAGPFSPANAALGAGGMRTNNNHPRLTSPSTQSRTVTSAPRTNLPGRPGGGTTHLPPISGAMLRRK